MMLQVAHFLSEFCTKRSSTSMSFVPVLFSVQRVARLYRLNFPKDGGNEIKTQTEALRLLETMLRWEYEEPIVAALLRCFDSRTLVVLLDGLDEASSLSKVFESLGQQLLKSGNRVMMTSRPEGVQSEEDYNDQRGWIILDLPELDEMQQYKIAKHQIDTLDGPFFQNFLEFQRCRKLLDDAWSRAPINLNHLVSELSKFNLEANPVATTFLNGNALSEFQIELFKDDAAFDIKLKNIGPMKEAIHEKILDELKQRYKRANLTKRYFDKFLDKMAADLGLRFEQVVRSALMNPRRLLQKAARNNGLSSVHGLVHGAVVLEDSSQLWCALQHLRNSAEVSTFKINNGFDDLNFMHYRCLTLFMFMKQLQDDGIEHSVELQLHIKPIYELKRFSDGPRRFFEEQGGLCGVEEMRRRDLKKRMDAVFAIGTTPVLLSVFLIYIKALTSKMSGEERDEISDILVCPPMPPSHHFLYQEAMWGALETRVGNPSLVMEVLGKVAFGNFKKGEFTPLIDCLGPERCGLTVREVQGREGGREERLGEVEGGRN